MGRKLIKRGAEAEIMQVRLLGKECIEKHRLPKGYRCNELDEKIRLERTKNEAKLLHRAKELGIHTPAIISVDLEKKSIFMEFIKGKKAKDIIKGNLALCREIGKNIALLHSASLVHGDLTTDNILVKNGNITFVDFGLGFNSDKEENRAVDLLNLKKTLLAGDSTLAIEWTEILNGYISITKNKSIEKKIQEVEERARYA